MAPDEASTPATTTRSPLIRPPYLVRMLPVSRCPVERLYSCLRRVPTASGLILFRQSSRPADPRAWARSGSASSAIKASASARWSSTGTMRPPLAREQCRRSGAHKRLPAAIASVKIMGSASPRDGRAITRASRISCLTWPESTGRGSRVAPSPEGEARWPARRRCTWQEGDGRQLLPMPVAAHRHPC